MAVRIGQPGHDGVLMKIDNARGVKLCRLFIGSDKNDAVAFYRDRFGVRLFVIDGVNVPVFQNKIDIFRADHWIKQEERQKRKKAHRIFR